MGDREGKPVVFKEQTPATVEKKLTVAEVSARWKTVEKLPEMIASLSANVASFIKRNGDAIVDFAITGDRVGFNKWLAAQTGFTPQTQTELLAFYDKQHTGILESYNTFRYGIEGCEKSAKEDRKGAQESFKESNKHRGKAADHGVNISENEALEAGVEGAAAALGMSPEKFKEKHGRGVLSDALKAGFDAKLIHDLSLEWNIRPPIEVVVPERQLGGEREVEFIRSAQQAIRDLLDRLKEISDKELKKALGRETYSREKLGAAQGAFEGTELEVAIKKYAKEQGLSNNDTNALIAKSIKLLAMLCEQKGLNPNVAVVVISSTKLSQNMFLDIAMRI